MSRRVVVATVVLACALTGGCSGTQPLMPTPFLYSDGHAPLFRELSPELQSMSIPVLFVTDRAPERTGEGSFQYGFGRSPSLAYGETVVTINGPASWEELARVSASGVRKSRYSLELTGLRELGRTPPTPFPYTARGGFFEHDPDVMSEVRTVEERFHRELDRRLALTPRKEVLLFVHGVNCTFSEAALTWAGMWHFFGREGVPVLYSWPAGHGGFGGYAYDRESGEFTVYHLKMLFWTLASNPGIEAVRIVAHSRGAAVVTSALRELFIAARSAGEDPLEKYRIRQLVLAAPDLDLDVTLQRLVADPVSPGIQQTTIYVSSGDTALSLAEWLFGSVKRIGRLKVGEFLGGNPAAADIGRLSAVAPNTHIVELRGQGGEFGHGYFYQNPAVSSDVMQVLRFDRAPGAQNGRPLHRRTSVHWIITDDYLRAVR